MSAARTDHLARETLARLRGQELEGTELVVALRHIGTCRDCVRAMHADDVHLDADEQIFPYVDGSLAGDDRKAVERHLAACAMCRAEVEDLAAIRTRAPRRMPSWFPLAAAAILVVVFAALFFAAPWRRTPPVVPTVTTATLPPIRPTPFEPTPTESPRYANARWNELVATAVANGRLPVASILATLNPRPDVLRGTREADKNAPAPAGVVLDTERPRFTWPETAGAVYEVAVYEGKTRVAASGRIAEAHWTPDARLRRGRTYVWQVTVTKGETTRIVPSPPAPRAMFHLISEEQHRALADAKSAHPDDHLLHAVLNADAGLRTDARAALQRAVAAGDPAAEKIRIPE